MDLHSPHIPRIMAAAVVFEPSYTAYCCKSHSTSYLHHHHTPTSSFYNLTVPFMAPTRKAEPTASASRIRRPPNAWIIYRSEKLKTIPPPLPGNSPIPQANISKVISIMWRAEPPEIRAHYERLSDILKIKHQLANPGYRFRPRNKAEKERLKQEKLAEKERQRLLRGARKSKPRRVDTSKPLFTNEARFGPGGPSPPSPPASGPSTPPVDQYSSLQFPIMMSLPTPPADYPVSPSDYSSTPVAPTSSPSPYPPSPASTAIPPLVAPQPGVPQRLPSASGWSNPQQEQLMQPNEQELNAFWPDHGSRSGMSQFATLQEYLAVPIPNHSQQPLGWSLDDPSPLTDQPLDCGMLASTDHPYTYDFSALDSPVDSRVVRVSMGPGTVLPFIGDSDDEYFQSFTGLFASLDTSTECEPSVLASTSGHSFDQQSASTLPTGFESYLEFDQYVDEQGLQGQAVFKDLLVAPMDVLNRQTQATVPYAPPAGASNSSRRVGAEWRHF